MLHKKQYKKGIAIVLVLVMLLGFTNSAYAEINEDYYNLNINGLEVVDSALNEKVSGSGLLNALGLLIYSVGSLLEWVLGKMYQMIAGQALFPWADAIVFNSIPLLDVNFISPTTVGGGSFLAIIRGTLSSVYSTIFGIAIAFFTIAVMIMGIKLVVSTIASEKAKYKQAVVQWAIGLLLLFVIHYAMSFIFYLNEQLVTIASGIASENLAQANEEIEELSNTLELNQEKVLNFFDTMSKSSFNIGDLLAIIGAVLIVIAAIVLSIVSFGMAALATLIVGIVMMGVGIASNVSTEVDLKTAGAIYDVFDAYWQKRKDEYDDISLDKAVDNVLRGKLEGYKLGDEVYDYYLADVAAGLLENNNYVNYGLGTNLRTDNASFWDTGKSDDAYSKKLYYDVSALLDEGISLSSDGDAASIPGVGIFKSVVHSMENLKVVDRITKQNYSQRKICGDDGKQQCSESDINYDQNIYLYCKALSDVFDNSVAKQASSVNIFTNLASFFKETAWTTSATGWRANKSVIQNALMYAILVVQSLILFIAYVKRLFYVTILAMMAPIVVVMDFFNKS